MKPNFTYTNLNKRETLYKSDDVEKIVLQCYVKGWPEPEITWWKNNVQINTTGNDSSQYKFTNNNQELHIVSLFATYNDTYSCKAKNRLAVLLLVIEAIILIYIFLKLRRERKIRKKLKEGFLMFFKKSALLHPELRVNDRSDLLQYDEKWEFSCDKLKLGKRLGTGEFGVVMKAKARGICGDDKSKTKVAVKVVKKSIEMTNIQALANELNILMYLGKHVNVVDLLGACTDNIAKRELHVIFEYCPFGNLRDYLIKRRHKFINQIDPSTGKFNISSSSEILKQFTNFQANNNFNLLIEQDMSADNIALISNVKQSVRHSKYIGDYKKDLKTIRTENLLVWAFQIAQGMKYLGQKNILHGDLAARNILLAKNNVVKISSFGLAKNMENHDFYVKKDDAPLPIKWLAIDSLKDEIFTTQSDVWSFGIMLWEFFSLGKTPYPGMELKECVLKVQQGYRMEKPEYATDEIYNIMFKCWLENPTLRPTFTELADMIGDFLDEQVQRYFIDLNSPYVDYCNDTKHNNLMIKSSQDQALE
ncbi:vascular endothelial growth factor receptor 2-like [Aphidius gifuensis]|uniref:vascular endothelial growth factor receptor 2-like n=1 Tax=Aphidius gifuensis TaxID=684658 RepID=UPI001CDC54A4|nr:vascular endothelial growth factor receptor 2-like [Aphidius gifuensis]